jgi:SAM-dependent methyltransferase
MSGADPYARLAGVYDEIVVDPCYGRWAAFLDELWTADPTGVRSVLDVGCGTGLMASELIALGYRVTGVDASAAMLARARRLLGPDAVLVRETLPDLTIDAVFDAAVSTFDALNYLTLAGLGATLPALADRLRPEGWLVFDVHTDAMMDFTMANPVVEGEADGRRFAITSVVDARARTCDSRIEVTRNSDGDAFSERHRQYFFTDGQIRSALGVAGFEVIAVTEEYTHEPVDASTLRATWTARRSP